MPTVAFNICCPRDCVSRTANVGTVGINGLIPTREVLYPAVHSLRLARLLDVFESLVQQHVAGGLVIPGQQHLPNTDGGNSTYIYIYIQLTVLFWLGKKFINRFLFLCELKISVPKLYT